MDIRNKLVATATATLLLATSFASPAAFVPVDGGFGAGSATRDTATGLVFLDVGLTTGLSYNQVAAQLGASGTFNGYRYATTAEVLTLLDDSGALGLNPVTQEASFFDLVDTILDIPAVDVFGFGDVLAYRGLTADVVMITSVLTGRGIAELVIDRASNPATSSIFTATSAYLRDDVAASPAIPPPDGAGVRASGSWLVRVDAVPEPSSAGLIAVAAAALVSMRRRRVERAGRAAG